MHVADLNLAARVAIIKRVGSICFLTPRPLNENNKHNEEFMTPTLL
jgi:hypothetical protein